MVAKTTETPRRMRSLRALGRSTSGNTMAMMAAAMVPLAAMTGSAVDMSRLYMAKVRLQQACDAGALAGRRFMTGATLDSSASAEAEKFFDVNFPADWMGTTEIDFTPVATADGQVHAEATATVPMALMQMFGKQPVELEVECDARFEISNTDIMFVLDITGSMNCAAADTTSTCTNNGGTEKSNSRAAALRTAVVDFYDTIDTAVDTSARLRLGFVPYSSGVNVGALIRAKNASWLSDTWEYQTRVANFNTMQGVPQDPRTLVTTQTYPNGSISQSNCLKYGQNQSFSGWASDGTPSTVIESGGPPPTQTINLSWYNDPRSDNDSETTDWGWESASDNDGDNRSCRRHRQRHPVIYRYKFDNWTYKSETIDVSGYKTGGSVTIPVPSTEKPTSGWWVNAAGNFDLLELGAQANTSMATASFTWDGCVEERKTLPQATYTTIPDTAYDLDIDLIPTSQDTRWRPSMSRVVWKRAGQAASAVTSNNGTDSTGSISSATTFFQPTTANTYYACPKAAQKLQEMTKAQVQSYVSAANGFRPIGGTYHDFGMIWGARLISPTGIFGDENAAAPNGKPIGRHIIFMTDGNMSPNRFIYGLYGLEHVDQRVSNTANPQDDALRTLHNARFSAVCNAARAKNITIWVVAYAQTMTPELQACADPGKAFYASSDQALKDQFKQIAQQIAQLRLSQ